MTPQLVWEDRAWLARVRRGGPDGWICGAAFLIDERHLVTCAHVVVEAGAAGPGQRVYVDMPMLDDAGCWADVMEDGWAQEDGTRGDTAVLQLERRLTGMKPVPVRAMPSLRGQSFLAYGFPRGYDDGREVTGQVGGPVGREWQQLEVAHRDLAVQVGFSGGAVWSTDLQAVVGLIVTRDAQTQGRVAFAVPLPVLAARSAIVARAFPVGSRPSPVREAGEPSQTAASGANAVAAGSTFGTVNHYFGPVNNGSGSSTDRRQPTTPTASAAQVRIFLCHSSSDKPAVRDLYQRLRQDGLSPWLDEEDLVPGMNWEYEIRKAVRVADLVVVCLSRGSTTKAGYVQREIKYALDVAEEKPEEDVYIVPLKLEDCAVPERLVKYHWLDFSQKDGYEKLVRTVAYVANRKDD